MKKNKLFYLSVFLFSFVLVGSFAPNVLAESITIEITADVAYVDDWSNILGGQVQVGDVITGSYTYETTTPDSNTLPTVGDYRHVVAPFGIHLNVGPWVFETDPNNVNFLVEIVNDHSGQDNYLLRSYNNIAIPAIASGALVDHISWQLDDSAATALNSIALPTTPPALADWESIFGLSIEGCIPDFMGFCDFDRFFIRAHVASATLVVKTVAATVDVRPDIVHLHRGGSLAAYIELPLGYSVEDIDVDSVALTTINGAQLEFPIYADDYARIGDYDGDGISDLKVRFDRNDVEPYLVPGAVAVTLSAELLDGTPIRGSDTITVIDKTKH